MNNENLNYQEYPWCDRKSYYNGYCFNKNCDKYNDQIYGILRCNHLNKIKNVCIKCGFNPNCKTCSENTITCLNCIILITEFKNIKKDKSNLDKIAFWIKIIGIWFSILIFSLILGIVINLIATGTFVIFH